MLTVRGAIVYTDQFKTQRVSETGVNFWCQSALQSQSDCHFWNKVHVFMFCNGEKTIAIAWLKNLNIYFKQT